MNRRGFLRAASATGLLLVMQSPAVGGIFGAKKSVESQIQHALLERKLLRFMYHGHLRVVEPHGLGYVSAGRLALHGWQESGGSASEPPPGWRTFVVAEIQSLRRLRKNFVFRADYRPETTQLKLIELKGRTEPKTSPNNESDIPWPGALMKR